MREATAPDDLSGADLVEVALAGDPVEGEMIRGLLQNGSISSILQPAGLNGPLLGIGLLPQGAPRSYGLIGAYARIWLWSLAALGVAFGVFLLARVT